MSVELKVPPVGESITEVQIGEWLKKEGDSADRDEVIVMIETDKVTVELPAPVTGVIAKIMVAAGEEARVGDVIGYMEEGAAATAQQAEEHPAEESPTEMERLASDERQEQSKTAAPERAEGSGSAKEQTEGAPGGQNATSDSPSSVRTESVRRS